MPRGADYCSSTSRPSATSYRLSLDRNDTPSRFCARASSGITVYDVRALVLPDEVLAQNLLGVSFLSRLKRYEVADGRLVLEQ